MEISTLNLKNRRQNEKRMLNAVVKQDGGYIVVESDEHQVDSGVRFIIRYL